MLREMNLLELFIRAPANAHEQLKKLINLLLMIEVLFLIGIMPFLK